MYKLFNQCNFYIFLWCLYYLQGTLYASGSIISQAILAILLVMSICNAYIVNRHYKLPIFFKGLNVLIAMFTIYGIAIIVSGEKLMTKNYTIVANHDYLKAIYISLLPIYSAYLYTIKGQLTKKSISIWIFFWILVATAQFYRNEREALEKYISNRTEITNNSGYIFLALLPSLVVFNKKPIIQFPLLLYCISFVVMGMKRGAIIIGLIIFCYFIYSTYKTSSRKNRKYIITFSVLAIIFATSFIMKMMSENDYFNLRVEQTLEGDSSGRDVIYGGLINHFLDETNALNFFFGNGAQATLKIYGAFAHNDWLEILINNGIIGVFTYIIYWICFVNSWLKSKSTINAFSALLMILLISFMQTLFSMSYGSLEIYMTLSLGYFWAISYKQISIRL